MFTRVVRAAVFSGSFWSLITVLILGGSAHAADYPKFEIKSNQLRVNVYLPDSEKGYYRGTRFDWAGVLGPIEFGGHTLFTPWKDTHDPTNNDDIVGPVDEFGHDLPLGYRDAKIGEPFVKIGVGELEKPKEEKYSFFNKYRILKPGTWNVLRDGTSRIEFTQELTSVRGMAYKYVKSIRVDSSILELDYMLRNTGTRPISTDVYNHNFFNVDADPVGPNYRFEFPFVVKAPQPRERFAELVTLDGKKLSFRKPLDQGTVFATLTGHGPEQKAGFIFRHAKSKLAVHVSGTAPLSKMNFWGMSRTICPEPFHEFKIPPGGEVTWRWRYDFRIEPK